VLLELFALGHVSCVFTCASWISLSIPYIRVLFCVYLNLFFDVFYLRQLFCLRDVSVTCVMFCVYLFLLEHVQVSVADCGSFPLVEFAFQYWIK